MKTRKLIYGFKKDECLCLDKDTECSAESCTLCSRLPLQTEGKGTDSGYMKILQLMYASTFQHTESPLLLNSQGSVFILSIWLDLD